MYFNGDHSLLTETVEECLRRSDTSEDDGVIERYRYNDDSDTSLPDVDIDEIPRMWAALEATDYIRIVKEKFENKAKNRVGKTIFNVYFVNQDRSWLYFTLWVLTDIRFFRHRTLFWTRPNVAYKHNRLHLRGFGMYLLHTDTAEKLRLHREPYEPYKYNKLKRCFYDLEIDKPMQIEGPHRTVIGNVKCPREKRGEVYEVYDYDSENGLAFEVPTHKTNDLNQQVYPIMRVLDGNNRSHCGEIIFQMKCNFPWDASQTERLAEGDFAIRFFNNVSGQERAILLSAACFVRFREFTFYYPLMTTGQRFRSWRWYWGFIPKPDPEDED